MERFQMYNENLIEQSAHFEGNETELLIERLCNPVILEQLVNVSSQGYMARAESGRLVVTPELDAQGEPRRDTNGRFILQENQYVSPTNDQIREQILASIEEIRNTTPISFGDEIPNSECIPLNWRIPGGVLPTLKQKSIMEAHEKGHRVRFFPGSLEGDEFYRKIFGKAFDFSDMSYEQINYQNDKERYVKAVGRDVSFEEARNITIDYLSDPAELTERMSQLKNYFGFKGDEVFTQVHLEYARDNYIRDTGMDNEMQKFFNGIVDESAFLSLMNEMGI